MRDLPSNIVNMLLTGEPFTYAHLIKIEKPVAKTITLEGDAALKKKDYVYLTDGSRDILFDDQTKDLDGNFNGTQTYIANKILQISDIAETVEARATALNFNVVANALSAQLTDTFNITSVASSSSAVINSSFDFIEAGFSEGDEVIFEGTGSNENQIVRLDFFTNNNKSVSVTTISKKVNDEFVESTELVQESSTQYTLKFFSPEVAGVLFDRESVNYSRFINRSVYIYKAFFDLDGIIIDQPFLIYKGVLAKGSIKEDPEKGSVVNWTVTSHWGDFIQVVGRLTSDESHRALDTFGRPDPESTIRQAYAEDLGFVHSEQAINLIAIYTVKETRYKVKYKKGLFGIGAKTKVKEYQVDVPRELDLRFDLEAKSLPVVYGVNKLDSFPIFVDVLKNNTQKIFTAYAICEGEVGGLLDIYIDNTSSVCADQNDFATRGQQTVNNIIDVLCTGRMDKGDTLLGSRSGFSGQILDAGYTSLSLARFMPNLVNSFTYEEENSPSNFALSSSANAGGIQHGHHWTTSEPLNTSIVFRSGKSNQGASGLLISQVPNFKLYNDYYTEITYGNLSARESYWGAKHRLLDTAYVTAAFTIKDGQTEIPELDFVVRGLSLQCYNYDFSYEALDSNFSDFNLGDKVDIRKLSDNTIISENAIIADYYSLTTNKGVVSPRIKFLEDPGIPDYNKFFITKQTSGFTDKFSAQKWNARIPGTSSGFIGRSATITFNSGNSSYSGNYNGGTLTLTVSGLSAEQKNMLVMADWLMINVYKLYNKIEYGTYLDISSYTDPATATISVFMNQTSYEGWVNAGRSVSLGDVFELPSGTYNSADVEASSIVLTYTQPATVLTDTSYVTVIREIDTFNSTYNQIKISERVQYPTYINTNTRYELRASANRDRRVTINPAIQLLDYLTSKRYGRGLSLTEDIDLESFLEAARVCDTQSNVVAIFSKSNDTPAVGERYRYKDLTTLTDNTISFATEFSEYRIKIGGSFDLRDYFWSGQTVEVTGSSSNNGTFTIVAVRQQNMSVSESVTTEGAGQTITLTSTGRVIFVGTVASVESITPGNSTYNNVTGGYNQGGSLPSYWQVEFEKVSGKLGTKIEDYKTFISGELVYDSGNPYKFTGQDGGSVQYIFNVPFGDPQTNTQSITGPLIVEEIESDVQSNPSKELGLVILPELCGADLNPFVRKFVEDGNIVSGYTLYDSDLVKYWRYLGWESQTQRFVTRHQTNPVINTATPVFDNINNFLGHFNGLLNYSNGKYGLSIKAKSVPSVATNINGIDYYADKISEDDIVGDIVVEDTGFKSSYNQVNISIDDPQNRFEARSLTLFNSNYLLQDKKVPKKLNLQTPFITNYFNARINAKQLLDESRYSLEISFTISPKGFLLTAGSIIRLSIKRFNWTEKLFRISNLRFLSNCLVQVTAEEHSDDAYLVSPVDPTNLLGGAQAGANSAAARAETLAPGRPSNLQTTTDQKGAITLTWTNAAAYNKSSWTIEIWRSDDASYSNASLIATTKGNIYRDQISTLNNLTQYYWIRYAVFSPTRNATGDILKEIYSDYLPLSTNNGTSGTALAIIDGVSINFSNDNTTIGYNANNLANLDYSNTSNTITASLGTTQLTYDDTVSYDTPSFRVSSVTSSGITAGTPTTTSNSYSSGNASNITPPAYIDFEITIVDDAGTEATFTRTQTFTVAETGSRGSGRFNIPVSSLPTTSAGADSEWDNWVDTPGDPIIGDQAWFYTGTLTNPTDQNVWLYEGASTWTEQEELLKGDLILADSIPSGKLSANSVQSGNLSTDSVVSRVIASNSIITRTIASNSVITNSIITNAIISEKIATNAVTARTIAAEAITTDKLAANAITTDKLAANAITTNKLAANSITAKTIAAEAITTDKLAANAITTDKLEANAITTDKLAANAVTTDTIASNAITTKTIAAGSVTTDTIAANAITTDTIASNAVITDTIAAGSVTTDTIAANAVTTEIVAANAIETNRIASNAIITRLLASSSVTVDKIAANAITTDKLAANAITTNKLAANSITAKTIAAEAITTDKLAANAVTTDTIASNAITTKTIAAGSVTTDTIAANAVTTDIIAANAVTADLISVTNIASINANIGDITAGTLKGGNLDNADNAPGTNKQGAFLDLTEGKMLFGSETKYIHFNGTNLVLSGVTIDATSIVDAAAGTQLQDSGVAKNSANILNFADNIGVSVTNEIAEISIPDSTIRSKVSAGNGLDYNSSTGVFTADVGTGLKTSNTNIELDFNSLGTATPVATDTFVFVDSGAEKQATISNIPLSIFNNDSGFVTSGTQSFSNITAGNGLTGGGSTSSVTLDVGAGSGIVVAADTVSVSNNVVRTAGDFILQGYIQFGQNVLVSGNLTVNGGTTSVWSDEVNIGDSIIKLNADETSSPSIDAGIEVERGTAPNKTLLWDETNDKWTVGGETFVAAVFEGSINASNITGEIVADGFGSLTTDDLTEGATNEYFTLARARASVTGGSGINYEQSSGTFSVNAVTNELVLNNDAVGLADHGLGSATYSSGISAIQIDAKGRVTSVTGSAGYTTNTGTITSSDTPASSELAVFTSGTNIRGYSGLTYNDTTLALTNKNITTGTGNIITSYIETTAFENTDPGTDDVRLSGYGILGNRNAAPIYISNVTAGGVQIGTGGIHGANTGIRVQSTYTDIQSGVLYLNGNTRTIGFNSNNNCLIFTNSTGYLELGSTGTDVEFNTGEANFVFNKTIKTSLVTSSAGDFAISRENSATAKLTVGASVTTSHQDLTVSGALEATTKSFVIPHPTKKDKKLRYGSLEGPENGVYVRGQTLSKIIELPEYWINLVEEDTITVNLTPYGSSQILWVEKIDKNKVYINSILNSINCFYTVFGERKDIDKLITEYDS